MPETRTIARTQKPEPDWELVLKRNPVERLKREKSPLGIRDELPALIAAGYEAVPEEDIVRLQWWGLYHDKPKIGTLHAAHQAAERARSRPAQLRAIGEVSNRFGTRRRRALDAPERPAPLARARRAARTSSPTSTRPGSRPRAAAATRCATSPAARSQGLDARRAVRLLATSSRRRRASSTGTRTTPTCRASTRSRSPPAPTAATRRRSTASRSSARSTTGSEGFARARRRRALVRAADRARPRRLRAEASEAIDGAARDPRRLEGGPPLPRLARQGAPQVHGRRHRRRGDARARSRRGSAYGSRTSSPPTCARAGRSPGRPRAEAGGPLLRRRPGAPRARDRGDQMVARRRPRRGARRRRPRHAPAELRARGRARRAGSTRRSARLAEIGFPLDVNPCAARSIACTGEPHCNFSVTETKTRLGRADRAPRGALRRRRRRRCGCTSTAARTPAPSTGSATSASRARRRATRRASAGQAYDIFVRGGLGPRRRDRPPAVPPRADRGARRARSRGSSAAGSAGRARRRGLPAFARRLTDDELGALAGLEPAAAGRDETRRRRAPGWPTASSLHSTSWRPASSRSSSRARSPQERARVGARALLAARSRSRRRSRSTASR